MRNDEYYVMIMLWLISFGGGIAWQLFVRMYLRRKRRDIYNKFSLGNRFVLQITSGLVGGIILALGILGFVLFSKMKARIYWQKVKNNPSVCIYDVDSTGFPTFAPLIIEAGGYRSVLDYSYSGKFIEWVGEDSAKGKIAFFDTICWGYYNAYANRRSIHFEPPPDSIVKILKAKYGSDKNDKNVKRELGDCDYGFYCCNR